MVNPGNSSANPVKMNLRSPVDFVGRVNELEGVLEALGPSTRAWIISLTGVGGIGKSELAIKAAHTAVERKLFTGVVWITAKESWLTYEGIKKEYSFVSLDDLLNTIINVLELHPQPLEMSLDRKKSLAYQALRSQSCLLIVDNLETIQDQAVIQFLMDFPPGSSKALVTTRLGGLKAPDAAPAQALEGQREMRVGPLGKEDAITLFLHRAESQGMHFSREMDVTHLSEVVTRAACIPLAIEWITSKMAFKGEDLTAIIEQLHTSNIDLLKYCFDSLISTVGSRAQKLLLAVSAFVDSVNEETLAAVTDMELKDQAKELEILNAASLLEKFGKRFRILAPTRLYVNALQHDLSEVYREYCIMATNNYFRLLHDVEQLQQWNSAESEQHNILTLLTWCFDNGQLELAFNLAHALSGYLHRLGLWDQRVYVCELATKAAKDLGKTNEAFQFTYDAAEIHKARGRLKDALEEFQRCEEYSREVGDKQKEAHAHMQTGIIMYHQHNYTDSIKTLQQSLQMHKANDDQRGIALNLSILGRNELRLGNLDQALSYFEESLLLKQHIGDDLDIAISQYDLGHLYHLLGNLQEALSSFEASLGIMKRLGEKRHQANAKWYYALLQIDQGNLEAARSLLTDVISIEEPLQRDEKIERAKEKLTEVEKTMNARKGTQNTDKLRAVQPARLEPQPDLVLQLMPILICYVSLGVEEFTRKFDRTTYANFTAILSALKQAWADDDEAFDTLLRFTAKPERYKPVLQDILREKLANNKELAASLSQLLHASGSTH